MPLLHSYTDPEFLIDQLKVHLPYSLPTLQSLSTPGTPCKMYSTLSPDPRAPVPVMGENEGGWIILLDMVNQIRFFHSMEGLLHEMDHIANNPIVIEMTKNAEGLVERIIGEFLRDHKEDRSGTFHFLSRRYSSLTSFPAQ